MTTSQFKQAIRVRYQRKYADFDNDPVAIIEEIECDIFAIDRFVEEFRSDYGDTDEQITESLVDMAWHFAPPHDKDMTNV